LSKNGIFLLSYTKERLSIANQRFIRANTNIRPKYHVLVRSFKPNLPKTPCISSGFTLILPSPIVSKPKTATITIANGADENLLTKADFLKIKNTSVVITTKVNPAMILSGKLNQLLLRLPTVSCKISPIIRDIHATKVANGYCFIKTKK